MPLIQKRGVASVKWFPKLASTVFQNGDAVSFNQAGAVIRTTSTSTNIVGIIKRDVNTTDVDFTATSLVPVQVLAETDEVEVDCSTTVTTAMIGTSRDFSNASTLNVGAGATVNQARILSIGSTTSKAVISIAKNALQV